MYNFEKQLDFLLKNDNYLWLYDKDKIYVFNLINNTIISTLNNTYNNLTRISSGNSKDNYIYGNSTIYSLNTSTNTLEILLEDIKDAPNYVYVFNDKIIFTTDTNNWVPSRIGSVIIYNQKTQSFDKYTNVRHISIDENNVYLVLENYKTYSIEKIDI